MNDIDSSNVEHIENIEFEMVFDPVRHDRVARLVKDGRTVRTFDSFSFHSVSISNMLAEAYEPNTTGSYQKKFLRLYA